MAAGNRAPRIASLTRLLRAKPDPKANPAEDCDPGYKTGFLKKMDGFGSLRAGQTRFVRARRRRAGLLVLLITAAGIVLGVLMPRIHAGATVPTSRAVEVLGAAPTGDDGWG